MKSRASAVLGHGARAALLVGGNALPLVGVLVWEWNLAALLVLYGIEGVVTAVFAALKTLFAEQVPSAKFGSTDLPFSELLDKRGGVAFREGWPPVYPRNLPFALGMAGSFLFVWVGIAVLVLADFLLSASAALPATVLLSAVGLVAARANEFRTEYIGRAEYTDVSARAAGSSAARQMILVVLLLPLLAVVDESRAAGTVLLMVIVAVKTLADAYGFWVDHLEKEPLRIGEWVFGNVETGDPPPSIDAPESAPDERVRTDTSAVLFTSLIPVALVLLTRGGIILILLSALLFLVVGLWALLAAAVVLAVVVTPSVLVHYARFGTLEYQRRGDALVCYDTLLDAPQWVCPVEEIRDPSARRRITSRLFGTTVVEFADDSGESYRLGPVSDADAAIERLGFPEFDTSQDDPNRQIAAAALGLACFFLAIPAVLYLAPVASEAEAVAVAFIMIPTMAMVVAPLLWVSLYNA
ncbi:DUF6498-containing protein [Halorussus pelagicus]|uniref:DUF6498-containing protein n=1 Tax=Halorussus pelagicus TaxID=2505977 RepID=UPI000FFBBE27|nr:DUF6498-containing protein [Halorussus pelagicus]